MNRKQALNLIKKRGYPWFKKNHPELNWQLKSYYRFRKLSTKTLQNSPKMLGGVVE